MYHPDPNHYNSATCSSYTDPSDPPYLFAGWFWDDLNIGTEDPDPEDELENGSEI